MARETVTIEGLDDLIRRLKALGVEASKRGGPVRAAVRKGAVVIQKEMQANVRKIVDTPNIGGQDYSTGVLEKSIRPIRARAHKTLKGETFYVFVPSRARYEGVKARGGTTRRVSTVGKWLEYGTAKRAPMPWARPAYHAKQAAAAAVMKDELLKGIEKLEKKLGRK